MLHYTYIACRFNVLLSFQVNSDRIEGFVFVTAAQSVFFCGGRDSLQILFTCTKSYKV